MADGTRTEVVGVLGCGLMGSGIAQVCAQAGYRTIVREVDQAAVDTGLGRIERFLANGVTRGKLTTDERDATMGRLSGTTSFEPFAEADLIIEAIVENIDAKRAVFAAVEEVVGPDTVFCSNTSSVCITELAAATRRPDKFIGLHFFSPVPIMSLVEVIRGLATVDATYQRVFQFAQSLGKQPVLDQGNDLSQVVLRDRRSPPRIGRASSSIGCSFRICSARFAPMRAGAARSKISTPR